MTSTPITSRLDEFLHESKDFVGKTAQQRHDLMRKSRALIMECLTVLSPRPSEQSVRASEHETNLDGVVMTRRPIYEGTIDEGPRTLMGIVQTILTAKKLGATNFEIDVVEVESRNSYGYPLGQSMFEQMQTLERILNSQTESWQRSASKTYKIILYAVTVK